MIRHSQSYLFGAISGTAVIAAAVVFFILLVSAQALRDWPISDLTIGSLGGSGDATSVAPAEAVSGGGSATGAAANLSGPITGVPATKAGGAAKSTGGTGTNASDRANGKKNGRVSGETRIQGGRGVASPPVEQPSSSAPTPAPTTGSSPAGSGTASPTPSGGGGATTGSGQNNAGPPSVGDVGTRTARRVTNTVREISSAATPPAPSPVTNATEEVAARAASPSTPSGSTTDRVKDAISGIGGN